jgi:anthranilate phosphoribosyltransferase
VLLNAAAAIVADGTLAGAAEGTLVDRMRAGLQHAATAVDSGAAAEVLQRWVAASSA